jgi:hypothetical protein
MLPLEWAGKAHTKAHRGFSRAFRPTNGKAASTLH